MAGTTETIAALVAETDSVLATGQGAGAITAARVRQLLEDLVASLAPPETTLTYSSSLSWNVSTSPIASVTLTGNVTITLSGGEAGQTYRLAIIQGGSGSYTIALAGCTVLGSASWATAVGAINMVWIYVPGRTEPWDGLQAIFYDR
jgi:hypothetical protein